MKSRKETTEQYWHCHYCGKDQDKSNRKCENCGKELGLNGEMRKRIIGDNDNYDIHKKKEKKRKSDDILIEDSDKDGSENILKKILKVLLIVAGVALALAVVFFLFIMFVPDPDPDFRTTTAATTASASDSDSSTSPSVDSEAVFPDFLEFANGYATLTKTDDLTFATRKKFKVDEDHCYEIQKAYAELLLESYPFEEMYTGESKKWRGFKYTGKENVNDFWYDVEDKYTDLHLTVELYDSADDYIISIIYGKGLEAVSSPTAYSADASDNTTYSETKVPSLSIPDFELFANGYGPKIKSITNSSNNLISVYYEIRKDEILDDYIELLESNYNFKLLHDDKNYNWKGFSYTGSEQLESFNTVLNVTDGTQKKYENNHLTAYVFNDTESGKRTIKFEYSRDLDVVDPIRKTTVS